MVGGPYDEATQNEIADVNAKAVKNDVNVYLWDPYVDGKISEDDWGYKNTGDIMKSDSINFMYTTLRTLLRILQQKSSRTVLMVQA